VRRLAVTAAAVLGAAALPLAAGAAAPAKGVQLTEAGGATFPVRAYVLSLPGERQLSTGQVQVTENGQPVVDLTVRPASAAGRTTTFGSVLVIDASDSMKGKPIASAMAAARAFAAQRAPNTRLGVITFSNSVNEALPLTRSKLRINAALGTVPATAFGTHIYDAVAKAEQMLQNGKIDSGTIVVLSDGADIGSTTSPAVVAKTARSGHMRLFTIGLRSRTFKPETLESLATSGGGEYALAKTTNDLTPLFNQIGAKLASEYLVRYKSLAGPDVPIKVSVAVPGVGTAKGAYQTPALPPKAVPKPYHPSLTSRILGSWVVIVVLALLGAAVVALLVITVLAPRRSELPRRMTDYVSVPGLQTRERRPGAQSEGAADQEEGQPQKPGLIARLDETLEIAHIGTTAWPLILYTVLGTLAAFLIVYVATGSYWWALLALLVPVGVRWWVLWRLDRRRKAFAEQLPDSLQVVASALRAGQSFAGALAVVVDSAGEPMKSEMQHVVADEQLGVPLDVAMAVVVKRMDNRDLEQVALVAELQREAGGNAAEVIDRVAETIRARFELRRLISTLTVQGRMSRWIVTALPIALVVLITLINPHYMHPLVSHTAGKVLIGLAVVLVIGGSLVIKRIVDIKV
jgi:tight adherence protein B